MAEARYAPKDTNHGCHGPLQEKLDGLPLVAIVGQPNVGKSCLFNKLTGAYVSVSNYPGTTVEVSQGRAQLPSCEGQIGIIDTPGMFSLFPITGEEQVARSILLQERLQAVVHVVDAKNLERMLPLTLQLIEAGFPVLLVLNMLDEAERLGLSIESGELSSRLKIPVVKTTSITGEGLRDVQEALVWFIDEHRAI